MAKDNTQSQKEIVTVLNNAVAATLRPARLGPIPEARLRRLHEVAKAIIAPAVELVEPDETGTTILEPEELVAIMAVAALYTHLTVVMKTARVPFGGLSKEIFD